MGIQVSFKVKNLKKAIKNNDSVSLSIDMDRYGIEYLYLNYNCDSEKVWMGFYNQEGDTAWFDNKTCNYTPRKVLDLLQVPYSRG